MAGALYLDTNILIYLLEHHEGLSDKVARQLEVHVAGSGELITSAIAVTEFLAGTKGSDLDMLRQIPRLSFISLNDQLAERAGLLQRQGGLQIGDAIHLATAFENKAESFFTNDKKLAKIVSKHMVVQGLE